MKSVFVHLTADDGAHPDNPRLGTGFSIKGTQFEVFSIQTRIKSF